MKITAHTLVKNEERYLWYSVMSVIDFVDEFLIWDTGSTDKTKDIIKIIQKYFPQKVNTKFLNGIDENSYTHARQQMLHKSHGDWILIVDGDEVWWRDSIKLVRDIVDKTGDKYETLVTHYYNVVGDIFHYQNEKMGKYKIDNIIGNLTIRAMSTKIPGLNTSKPHGQHGFFDKTSTLIQDRKNNKRLHLPGYGFMHFTHMVRSSSMAKDSTVIKRKAKHKYDLGVRFPLDFYYPEIFFKPRPEFVQSVWQTRSKAYQTRAIGEAYPKKIKRKIMKGGSGY